MALSQITLQSLIATTVHYYDSVDSTNDIAMTLLQEGVQTGVVVIADEQRKGKGRKGRTWFTPAGVALALSIVLRPTPMQAHKISMIGALAVLNLCQSLGLTGVGIKWPNDVQVNGKKVCGILPEASWKQGKLAGVVLGMGVNIRVPFADDLQFTATNLETALGQGVNRADCLAFLVHDILRQYHDIEGDVWGRWKNALTTIGQQVTVDTITGLAESVDESGALMVRSADGIMHRVLAGDVILQPNQEG